MTLSVVMVTYNSADVVEKAVKSVQGVADEVLVGDGGSTDATTEIVKKYGGKIVPQGAGAPLGVRKQNLVEKAKGKWILVLDADERISFQLAQEMKRITAHHKIRLEHKNVMDEDDSTVVAYRIPYQNYVFGKPVYYGGERYAKVRLFRRGYGRISPKPLHEEIILNGQTHKATPSKKLRGGLQRKNTGELRGVIRHHSYRTPWQLFAKFTRYAWVAASEKERQGATLTLKLILYGPHMFWARFIKEKGYKDGWRGLVLAAAFAYMEGLTYWLQLLRKFHKAKFHKATPCKSQGSGL